MIHLSLISVIHISPKNWKPNKSVHRSLTKWGILNGKSIECFSVNLQNSRRSRHNCNALPPQCHTVTIFCVTKPPWASIHSIALVHPQWPWVDQTAVDLPTFLKQYFNSQPSCIVLLKNTKKCGHNLTDGLNIQQMPFASSQPNHFQLLYLASSRRRLAPISR